MDRIKIKVSEYYGNASYYSVMPQSLFDLLEAAFLNGDEFVLAEKSQVDKLIDDYKNAMIGVSKDTLHQLEIMRSNYNSIQKKIDNIISVISQSGSASLLSTLEKLDEEKALLESKIEAAENDITQHDIDACEIISA